MKIMLRKSLILVVLLYEYLRRQAVLKFFERKFFHKLYGSVCIRGEYKPLMNHKLYELYADIVVVRHIKVQSLCWLGYIVRMNADILMKRSFA